jgi:hypothetical protein
MRVFDARLGDVDLSDPKLIEYHEEPMTSLSATVSSPRASPSLPD